MLCDSAGAVQYEELGGHHTARQNTLVHGCSPPFTCIPALPVATLCLPLRRGPEKQHIWFILWGSPDKLLRPLPITALLVTVQPHTGHVVIAPAATRQANLGIEHLEQSGRNGADSRVSPDGRVGGAGQGVGMQD